MDWVAGARRGFCEFGRCEFDGSLRASGPRDALCPFSDERSHAVRNQSCIAGDHQWCRGTERLEDDSRVEFFHASAQDAAVPPARGMVRRKQLEARIRKFQDGQWLHLLNESSNCAEKACQNTIRRRRRRDDDDGEAKRAARAVSLVRVGGLPAAR